MKINKIAICIFAFLIISAIIILCFIININSNSSDNNNLVENELTENSNSIAEEIKELDDKEKDQLFIRIRNVAFLQELMKRKNIQEFNDSEIVELLPVLDVENIFESDRNIYKYASKEDIQKLAQKYFGKEVNFNNINSKRIEYRDGFYYVSTNTGYGIVKYELNYIKSIGKNQYDVSIKYLDVNSSLIGNYILSVEYYDQVLIYKAFRVEE